jgi:tRNA/rRNA methyltransferase/tRNA (cytidine32/uridine32-2'-O)-methyltransferase
MHDPPILQRFRVVLWRPKSPGNVGSVARAMKNMGFTHLQLADPLAYEDPGYFAHEAGRLAWNATDVLERREEHPSIAAAVSDASLLVGFTARRLAGRPGDPPRTLAPHLLEAARRGPVALLFGQEDIGLTLDELARCQVIGTIPSSGNYTSLNLAQSVLIVLYELRLAALAAAVDDPESPPADDPESPPATDPEVPTRGEIDGCFARLSRALDDVGYFAGTGRAHMERELRIALGDVVSNRRGLTIIEGIAHRIRLGRRRE